MKYSQLKSLKRTTTHLGSVTLILLLLITALISKVNPQLLAREEADEKIFFPTIWSLDHPWVQLQPQLPGIYSVAECTDVKSTSSTYVGAPAGLLKLMGNEWNAMQGVPGHVRDIVIYGNCDKVMAAPLGNGVWANVGTNEEWNRLDSNVITETRSLLVVNDIVFAGAKDGIYTYSIAAGSSGPWTLAKDAGQADYIARLSKTDDTDLYAIAWKAGVLHCTVVNTADEQKDCSKSEDWNLIQGPPGDSFGRDVIGLAGKTTPEILLATASQVWKKIGDGEWTKLTTPWSSTEVYSLAQHNGRVFAGVKDNGVWVTSDGGNTWSRYGSMPKVSSNELTIGTDGWLYAATLTNGVWRIRLP